MTSHLPIPFRDLAAFVAQGASAENKPAILSVEAAEAGCHFKGSDATHTLEKLASRAAGRLDE